MGLGELRSVVVGRKGGRRGKRRRGKGANQFPRGGGRVGDTTGGKIGGGQTGRGKRPEGSPSAGPAGKTTKKKMKVISPKPISQPTQEFGGGGLFKMGVFFRGQTFTRVWVGVVFLGGGGGGGGCFSGVSQNGGGTFQQQTRGTTQLGFLKARHRGIVGGVLLHLGWVFFWGENKNKFCKGWMLERGKKSQVSMVPLGSGGVGLDTGCFFNLWGRFQGHVWGNKNFWVGGKGCVHVIGAGKNLNEVQQGVVQFNAGGWWGRISKVH